MTKIDGNNRNQTCELFLIFKAPNTKDKGKWQQHEKTKQNKEFVSGKGLVHTLLPLHQLLRGHLPGISWEPTAH